MNSPGFQLVFGLVLLLVGGGVLLGIVRTFAGQQRVRAAWATAPGQIVRHAVQEEWNSTFGSPMRTLRNDLAYTYVVGGQSYTGTRVSAFTLQTDRPGRAQGLAARYPVGQAVTVHYNPHNPAEALLEPTGQRGVGVLGAGLTAALAVAGWLILRDALARLG